MADRFDDATQVLFLTTLELLIVLTFVLFTLYQKELQAFLDREQAQARVQQSIHTFTSMCWDKYVFSTSFSCPSPI